ncbi:MAG: 2,3-dihydroxyphenylpropionate/2,3-dihydroxicinnamic acid 1,2-dioxygenase [Alphaproteobacteria bacterium MarineAlpha11_Bin1]|nr:MAG: 2,3-dihydroxyphenylpropionate/2,3-dihydroxicinnamic acid 1,2-dioxygenase [Alphaproteobacteria bacterium MarineAlpha11_Bin1]|tara:strand:- start:14728 stop:15786 length:1059 start_codon:yes stop_codon:yes gene_type:complete
MVIELGTIGGVCMAHAPQFLTLPQTEDLETVKRIRSLATENGRRLKELKPDLAIVIANDHANQFLLKCVSSFVFHRGEIAKGHFAGSDFAYEVSSATSTALLRCLQEEKFDPAFTSTAALDYAFGIPLTFLEIDLPIIPIYVNAYVPPQPSMERCYHFGQAIDRGLKALGIRAIVIASGGLSHFPGTSRYAKPATDFDLKLIRELSSGNLRWLLSLDEKMLDETGNIELRCWSVAAGMLGERSPDAVSFDPSWHHNYATFAWWSDFTSDTSPRHYPTIAPERVDLTDALHQIAYNEDERENFKTDRVSFARQRGLPADEAAALIAMDHEAFKRLGIHPFVTFMAALQLERKS